MSPHSDLEAFSPLSFSSYSRRRRRFLSFALLLIPGSFILVLYLQNQLPFSLDASTITLFPSTKSALEPYTPCSDRPTSFYHPRNSSNLYLLFTPSDPATVDTSIRRIASHDVISNECLEEWVGKGRWSGECLRLTLEEPRVDLVWTWVNGSDPLHRSARETHPPSSTSRRPSAGMLEKQYRQHDELRFSLRSAKAATKGWKQTTFHLVANSYPIPSSSSYEEYVEEEEEEEERLGQVPQWLDLRKMGEEVPRFVLHHDADLFRLLPSSPNVEVSDTEIDAWREASLPTFNSMAIESQLANLPPSDVSENTVFFMDDTYFLRPLSTSTFYSPIHGPILHLQPDLLVNPHTPGKALPSGWSEWRGLETAATRLSERFGTRGRPYLVHNARAIPLPLLHEASLTFPHAFSSTATSRFRGQDDSKPETHTLWLATQFIVERHREALLWSWVVGKWGGRKGRISREEKEKMWLELGGESGQKKKILWPKRDSRLSVREELNKAGLPDSGITNYAFVSSDGYPYTYLPLTRNYPLPPRENGWANLASTPSGPKAPMACTIDRAVCFNDDAHEPAVEMLKRIMVDKPQCGDCVISALIASSGSTGLSAFLPPPPSSDSPPSSTPNYLPVTLSSLATFPYPTNPYLFSLRLIQRYSYVLGGTPSRFFGVKGADNARAYLRETDNDKDTALVCINDDLTSTDPRMVASLDGVLNEWMTGRWPNRLGFERVDEGRRGEELCV